MPKFSKTIQHELVTLRSLLTICLVALLYIGISVFLLNFKLLTSISGTLIFKFSLFTNLFLGFWASLSPTDVLLSTISALFVGLNILLLGKTIYVLEHSKRVRLSFGTAAIVSLVSTGCASCGLSVLSLLGLSASLSFLPFKGLELHLLSIFLLLFSSVYMLKKLHEAKYCIIKK